MKKKRLFFSNGLFACVRFVSIFPEETIVGTLNPAFLPKGLIKSKLLKFQNFHTFPHAHSDGISVHRNIKNGLLTKHSLLKPSPFSNEYSDWNANVHNGASDQVASDVKSGA